MDGSPVYSDVPGCAEKHRGLLMNARFIQGIFDDKADPKRFARFGHDRWDPEANTDRLIAALPEWHRWGLRAFTVGFQGGGPVATTDNATIDNNPFGEDGKGLDPAYARRMDRLIRGAAGAGFAVIVSFLYQGQQRRLRDAAAVKAAVTRASRFLKEGGYGNVLIEVANEYPLFRHHPIVGTPQGMAELIALARRESGGLPAGSSGGGGDAHREVCAASDYVLIHGNGLNRQQYYNLVRTARAFAPGKPVVCNEDSPCITQLDVAFETASSWGYYNNMTKQEPPADWGVTAGEDRFFARRMAEGLGIEVAPVPFEERFHLQGLEPRMRWNNRWWVRLASLHPEKIRSVDFLVDGRKIYTAYDVPHFVNYTTTWLHDPWTPGPGDREVRAIVRLTDGVELEKRAAVP